MAFQSPSEFMGENFLFEEREMFRKEKRKLDTFTLYFFENSGIFCEIVYIKAFGSLN